MSSDMLNGVKSFIDGTATVVVHFPVDWQGRSFVCCVQCPYLSSSKRYCQLNQRPVQFPERYIGYDCPLNLKNKRSLKNEKV